MYAFFINKVQDLSLLVWAIFLAFPGYILFGKIFIGTWDDFLESLRYFYQPGWLSLLRGELNDDFWETVKLYLWLIGCACSVKAVYEVLQLIF